MDGQLRWESHFVNVNVVLLWFNIRSMLYHFHQLQNRRDHGFMKCCLFSSKLAAYHIGSRCHIHTVLVNTSKHNRWSYICSSILGPYLPFMCASSSCIFCRCLSFRYVGRTYAVKPNSVNFSSNRFARYANQNTTVKLLSTSVCIYDLSLIQRRDKKGQT